MEQVLTLSHPGRAATTGHPVMLTYRPPRLGDLVHVRLGDGDEHTALVHSIADDGHTIKIVGHCGRRDLTVVIRRVGTTSHTQET